MTVVMKFYSTGVTHDLRVDNTGESIEEEKMTRIKNHFQSIPTHSTRVPSRELDIPYSSIQTYFKDKSHFKPLSPTNLNK